MFFGRRKHVAPTPVEAAPASPAATAPELTDELVFAAVQRTMQAVFGEHGEWTVARRSDEQTDQIFHEVLVHSLATAVTASIAAARGSRLAPVAEASGGVPAEHAADDAAAAGAVIDAARVDSTGFDEVLTGGPLGLLRAPRQNPWLTGAPAGEADSIAVHGVEEGAAFSWEPAPITRWADLKRPVTGPVAVVSDADDRRADKAA